MNIFNLNGVKCNLTKLTNNECAVSCISGQVFLSLAVLRLLCSRTLQRGVRSLYHGGISVLFSEFFPCCYCSPVSSIYCGQRVLTLVFRVQGEALLGEDTVCPYYSVFFFCHVGRWVPRDVGVVQGYGLSQP